MRIAIVLAVLPVPASAIAQVYDLPTLAQGQAIDSDKAHGTAEFGAKSQEFGLVMNAANTAIKALGEASQGMARKQ